jgi:4-hydroxy-3-polyprenylbenzoate decarboxylase
MEITLAITGATGVGFGVAIARRLALSQRVQAINLLLSPTGRYCLLKEYGIQIEDLVSISDKIKYFNEKNLGADIASGSNKQNGMAIVPCSTGTLGRIASGTSESLITRVADVCLKERWPLILCVRETPLNRIHLENMLKANDAGALIMPIAPSFYHSPKTIEDLFQAFATRIMDQLNIVENDHRRWKETNQ